MTSQPGVPKWVELTDAYRQRLEIAEEVLSSGGENGAPASELERFRMLASMHEWHVSELLDALVSAEGQLEQANELLHVATAKPGKGNRPRVRISLEDVVSRTRDQHGDLSGFKPDRQTWFVKQMRVLLLYAAMDKEEAIRRERDGLQPLDPATSNMVCGSKGLSKPAAATRVLTSDLLMRSPTATKDRIDREVGPAVDGLVKAYDREYPKKGATNRTKKTLS
jgi:hypothetical protein